MIYAGLPNRERRMASVASMSHSKVDVIERSVCHALSVTIDEINSSSKNRTVSDARKILFTLVRKKTGISFKRIGRRYHRDHSTVMAAVDSYEELNETDRLFRSKVKSVFNVIKQGGII